MEAGYLAHASLLPTNYFNAPAKEFILTHSLQTYHVYTNNLSFGNNNIIKQACLFNFNLCYNERVYIVIYYLFIYQLEKTGDEKMNSVLERLNPFFEWITKIAGTNLLWVLFNFPIAYLALSLFTVKEMSQITQLLITIAILAPFIFFPATTAMFGVVRKWVMKEEVPTLRFFWKYYKENYKRSLVGGLVLTVLWAIVGVDYFYFHSRIYLGSYLFLFLAVWLFTITLFFFSHTVHTETKFGQALKNVFILSIVNPILSFGIAIINLVILYISVMKLTFLLPFFSGAIISFLGFFAYYKVFTKLVLFEQNVSEQKSVVES